MKILTILLLSTTLMSVVSKQTFSQTVLTLQPGGAAGKDATISNFPGESSVNYGANVEFISESDAINFSPYAKRGLIQFDLSSIPTNATVISAYLSLYAYNIPGTGGHLVQNNNTAWLYKVEQAWNETTVNWTNKPNYSTVNGVSLPISDSTNQNYTDVDVRNLIQEMVSNPTTNFGLLFRQQYECTCNGRMVFASSDHSTAALRPKLVVTYAICSGLPPAATISPSGSNTICYGDNINLTASTAPGYNYQWFRNGIFIPGQSSGTLNVSTSGAYTVKVTNQQGCTTLSAPTTITVSLENAKITTSTGSTTQGCANGGLTMNASAQGTGNTYAWRQNGWYNGANGSSYTTPNPGNYSCWITNSTNTCSYLTNTIQSVQQVATVTTSGSNYFCTNGSFDMQVSVNIGNNRTYQWQVNGVDIPGANGFGYSATTSGNYRCIIDDAMCTGNTISPSHDVFSGVPPHIKVVSSSGSSPLSICNGQTAELTIEDAISGAAWGGGGATWYKDGNLVNTNGGIPVLQFVDQTGGYTATLTTSCGISSSAYHGIFNILSTNAGTPVPQLTPSGSITACPSVDLSYSNGIYPVWLSHQWKRNGVNIAGAIAENYTATQSGVYTLELGNSCGTVMSSSTTININNPIASITASGPTTICSGESVTLNANTGTGLTYQWKKYGVNIPGATGPSYTTTKAGKYKVVVTNANGCFKGSNTIQVTVIAKPAAVITAQGSTSICAGDSVNLTANTGAGLTYQWKKYAQLITGATSSEYQAKTAGSYKCIVSNSNGCTKASNAIQVSIVCREAEANIFGTGELIIFPNPSLDGIFQVEINDGITDYTRWHVTDITGRLVPASFIRINPTQIKIHIESKGVFLLSIPTDTGPVIKKLVSQ